MPERYESDNPQFDHLINNMDSDEIPVRYQEPKRCPVHGMPDCSPLLNGCTELSPDA